MKCTDKSKENIHYLKKYYKPTYNIKSKYVLKQIHNVLKKINIRNYKYKYEYKHVHEKHNYYFPNEIVNTINKTKYNIYSFVLKKNNYTFKITLHSETKLPIESYIQSIKTILLFLIYHKPIKRRTYHTINIYLTSHEKKLIHHPIKPLDVNSGFSNRMYIIIYRKEEWFKVLIHECIHLFNLDTKNSKYDDMFHRYFNIKDTLLVCELYTEFWSRILNICYISSHKSFIVFYKTFRKYFKMEQLYSALSLKKILKWNDMVYTDLYGPNTYREETNTFCYYVLTALLYHHVDDSLKFFLEHNINILQFNGIHTKKFIHFVYRLHKNKSWVDYLDNLKYFDTPNINMSLYDLKFT